VKERDEPERKRFMTDNLLAFGMAINGLAMVVSMMLSGAIKNAISLVPLYAIAGIFLLVGVMILVPLFKLKSDNQTERKITVTR
jgi:hypothetical protein